MANTNQAIGEAEKALAAQLLEAGCNADAIDLRADPGPAGTVVVSASGLPAGAAESERIFRTAVVEPQPTDDASQQAHVYGEGFAKRFSDFVRDRGWLEQPPDAALLVALLSPMRFEGRLEIDPDHAPSVSTVLDGLVLRFVRKLADGSREWVRVHTGGAGAEDVQLDARQA
jgi:hypothetical protein